jgi:Helix-turn-helix domain of resolvase
MKMGRPSKLSDIQWAEIGRRLAKGEKPADLAREYRISKALISNRFSKRIETLKTIAKQVAEAETAFSALPISEQVSVRSLADDLKSISSHLASAAKFGSMTAHKLNAIANVQAEQIDETASLDDNAQAVRSVVVMTEAANKAAVIGLNLLAANKDRLKSADDPIDITPTAIPDNSVDASRAYMRLINGQ